MANTDTKVARSGKAATGTEKTATAAAETAQKAAEAGEKTLAAARSVARDAADLAFSYARFEVPEVFRSFAEQALSQTRDTYARMKAAAEETTDSLEESLETARDSFRQAQFKALDAAKANADATFELYRRLLKTNSVADAVALQTAFARERFEAFIDYSKEMQATLGKVGAEAAKPAKVAFERTLNLARAA